MCSYCYFLDKELFYPDSKFRMSEEILEAYIKQLIKTHRSNQDTITWQGGESTLMGVDFFRNVIVFQERNLRPGMTIGNTMQTNCTLLDEDGCEFFKANNGMIGISIDGPVRLHSAHRVGPGSGAIFEKVMRRLQLLQKHQDN